MAVIREIPFKLMSEISRARLQQYAQASGDQNPIHLDDVVARKMGLPGVIAHGMLIAGMLGERGLEFFKEASGQTGFTSCFNARFRAMVFPEDRISIGGVVRSSTESEWVLELQAKNQKDEVTTSAVMTVKVSQSK